MVQLWWKRWFDAPEGLVERLPGSDMGEFLPLELTSKDENFECVCVCEREKSPLCGFDQDVNIVFPSEFQGRFDILECGKDGIFDRVTKSEE